MKVMHVSVHWRLLNRELDVNLFLDYFSYSSTTSKSMFAFPNDVLLDALARKHSLSRLIEAFLVYIPY